MSIFTDLDFSDYGKLMELANDFRNYSLRQADWAEESGLWPAHQKIANDRAMRTMAVAIAVERFARMNYDPQEKDDV